MIEFRTQTDIKACVLNEMASVYLVKRIINRRQLSCINFPPKINHYEASSAKHWITITLFLQGLNLLFTACYSMGLRWFLSSSMFDGKFIGLISSIFAGKSMMARPEEQRPRWTKKKTISSLNIKAEIPIYLGQISQCWQGWRGSDGRNTITRLQRLYGNRFTRTRQPLLQKPSYLEFLRDDEIIDHSVEEMSLNQFRGDYFEPWISGPVSA
ncbi:hypothetical protein AAG906_016504 [Vitis piasezkii]